MIEIHAEFISRDGKPEFAVLPIEEFDRLKSYLEDMEDLLDLHRAKSTEADAPTIGIDELKQKLNFSEPCE